MRLALLFSLLPLPGPGIPGGVCCCLLDSLLLFRSAAVSPQKPLAAPPPVHLLLGGREVGRGVLEQGAAGSGWRGGVGWGGEEGAWLLIALLCSR